MKAIALGAALAAAAILAGCGGGGGTGANTGVTSGNGGETENTGNGEDPLPNRDATYDNLVRAVALADPAEVRRLLAAGVDPNRLGDSGGSPLLLATTQFGEGGADVDAGDAVAVVRELLDAGADPNMRHPHPLLPNITPLQNIVSSMAVNVTVLDNTTDVEEMLQVVSLMLDAGADPNVGLAGLEELSGTGVYPRLRTLLGITDPEIPVVRPREPLEIPPGGHTLVGLYGQYSQTDTITIETRDAGRPVVKQYGNLRVTCPVGPACRIIIEDGEAYYDPQGGLPTVGRLVDGVLTERSEAIFPNNELSVIYSSRHISEEYLGRLPTITYAYIPYSAFDFTIRHDAPGGGTITGGTIGYGWPLHDDSTGTGVSEPGGTDLTGVPGTAIGRARFNSDRVLLSAKTTKEENGTISSDVWGRWLEHSAFLMEIADFNPDSANPARTVNFYVNGDDYITAGDYLGSFDSSSTGKAEWKGLMAGHDARTDSPVTGKATVTVYYGHTSSPMGIEFTEISGPAGQYGDIVARLDSTGTESVGTGTLSRDYDNDPRRHGTMVRAGFFGPGQSEVAGWFSALKIDGLVTTGPGTPHYSYSTDIEGVFAGEREN